MKALKGHYEKGWQALVKIDKYVYNDQALGPLVFPIGMVNIFRKDFTVVNEDG